MMAEESSEPVTARGSGLPVDALLPEIFTLLRSGLNLVLVAAPGAGKTTRVPPLLMDLVPGQIVVLEPRRIAARLAAHRVAAEMGEEVGGRVGYQVRFEDVTGSKTKLVFVTEGLLTRRLLSDPDLRGVDLVVLDEFHERQIEGDLALALLRRLQRRRPTFRIVVMSATLDAAPVAHFLGDCPILRSSGRQYPITIRHLSYSAETLPQQVRRALAELEAGGAAGHTLVFLPGSAEIRRAMRECEGPARAAGLLMLPLHGDLTPAEQDRAIAPSRQRKLILATNVAESSVTIDGVDAVIDSGLARIATYSQWTGLPTLSIGRISKASAAQRAGRAGRTGPGQVLRLYPEEDYQQRREYDTPELLRGDLSQVCLSLRAMNLPVHELAWLDAPSPEALQRAETLLDSLQATGDMAQRLVRFPLSARLSRMLVEAVRRGVAEEGCRAAALLGSGERIKRSDLLAALDLQLEGGTLQLAKRLRQLVGPARHEAAEDEALLLSALSGFSDRVGRLRGGREVLLSSGVTAELAEEPPAYEFMVAIEVEDRPEKPLPLIRMTARIEPEWLIDLFPDRVREQSDVVWNRLAERADAVETLVYDSLVLQETRDGQPEARLAADLLARKAMELGVDHFVDAAAMEELKARIDFAGLAQPAMAEIMRAACDGLRSFAQLRSAAKDLLFRLEQTAELRPLRALAPAEIRLAGGRQTKVHYETGKVPWIASRLQDFFGMQETPRIGAEKTPVVVHLLAPNKRAVQTTTDLSGFWKRLYPQVRRELMRRYPRHAWPEQP